MKHHKFKTELNKGLRRKLLSYWHKLRDKYRDSEKLTTYFDIKDNFKMEEYLNIKKNQYRQIFCKFRISAIICALKLVDTKMRETNQDRILN
jgi:hypothetical protein